MVERDVEAPRRGVAARSPGPPAGGGRQRRASLGRLAVAWDVVVEVAGPMPIVGSGLQASSPSPSDPDAPDLLGLVRSAPARWNRTREIMPTPRMPPPSDVGGRMSIEVTVSRRDARVWPAPRATIASHCRAGKPRSAHASGYGPPDGPAARHRPHAAIATRRTRRSDPRQPHIRKTPNRVSGIGAWSAASMPIDRTRRVSSGSMTPSSHSRAVAKYGRALALVGLEDRRLEGVALGVRRRSRRGPSTARAPPAARP